MEQVTGNRKQRNEMQTIPKSQNHLAEMLGISKAQASRCVKKGMPTNTFEAAQVWRRKYLNIAQRNQDSNKKECVKNTSRLMVIASNMLDAGISIVEMTPALRESMRLVSPNERDLVDLRLNVIQVLTSHILGKIPPKESAPRDNDGELIYASGDMSDDEAQESGEIWYQIAAGEILYNDGFTPFSSNQSHP